MKKYIVILTGLFLLISCNKKNETETENSENVNVEKVQNRITLTNEQLNNIDIEIIEINKGSMPSTIRLNARTESTPQDRVSVSNVMGGFVKSIEFLPGAFVKKGQVLAVMEDPSYVQLQEDYLTTKALLTQATLDYNRQKDLNESQAASTKILESAKTEMNLLQIKKRSIEEKLQLININPLTLSVNTIKRKLNLVSPVSGIINEIFANKGQYVSNSQPIFEIIQSGTPLLNIKAFENNLQYLRVGQELEAFTNQNPNEKILAKIVSITQHVNEDGSVDVLAKITKNNNIHFTSNMYFNVDLTYESVSSNMLPIASVVHFDGKDYIYEVIDANTFNLKEIKIGGKTNDFIEIQTPLDSTKKYAGKGAYGLLMAMKNSSED